MATSENNRPHALRNAQVEVKTLIYEIRIVLEALSHGLKALLNKPSTEPLKGELVILENFANQLVEALESYKESLEELLSWSPEAHQA
jgi:hypothetical protein